MHCNVNSYRHAEVFGPTSWLNGALIFFLALWTFVMMGIDSAHCQWFQDLNRIEKDYGLSNETDFHFKKNVKQYFENYETDNNIHRAVNISRISNTLFRDARINPDQYNDRLLWLNIFSSEQHYIEAYFDLAKSLQLRWETRFGKQLKEALVSENRLAAETGAMVGMLGLGVSLLAEKSQVSLYFRLFRHLMPLLGTLSGTALISAHKHSGLLNKTLRVPVAPAAQLGVGAWSDQKWDEGAVMELNDRFVDSIIGLTSTVAVSSVSFELIKLAFKQVRWLRYLGGRVSKNIYIAFTATIVGVLVEYGAQATMNRFESKNFVSEIENSKNRIHSLLLIPGNELQVFTEVEALTKKTVSIVQLWNRPIWDELSQLHSLIDELNKDYSPNDPNLTQQINELYIEFHKKIEHLKEVQRATSRDPDIILRGVEEFLNRLGLEYFQTQIHLLQSLRCSLSGMRKNLTDLN